MYFEVDLPNRIPFRPEQQPGGRVDEHRVVAVPDPLHLAELVDHVAVGRPPDAGVPPSQSDVGFLLEHMGLEGRDQAIEGLLRIDPMEAKVWKPLLKQATVAVKQLKLEDSARARRSSLTRFLGTILKAASKA